MLHSATCHLVTDAMAPSGTSFETFQDALQWLNSVIYENCDRAIVTHDVTQWVHDNVRHRQLPYMWIFSDPYLKRALNHWCRDVDALSLCRFLIFEPSSKLHHRLRVVHEDSDSMISMVGLRAPHCYNTRGRMSIAKRAEKGWSVHSQPASKPVVLLCEYQWLHLSPGDLLAHRIHLAAPVGWFSKEEVEALRPGVKTVTKAATSHQNPMSRVVLKPTADVINHLQVVSNAAEFSILRDMRLVSAEMAYHCIRHLYAQSETPVEVYLHAHFECPDTSEGDAPSHLRLRQAATLLKDSNRRSDVVLFSVTPAFTRANMDEEDHEPYHRLLYDMRSLFCSASYKVRHASANIEHRRLILPFGHWKPIVETTTGIAGGFPRVSYPYGWPVVICINGQCVLPSIAWCSDNVELGADAGSEFLYTGSTVREIEEVYLRNLCLPSVPNIMTQAGSLATNGVAVLVLGGKYINAEQSIQHQHLCLVLLLLMCGHGPLCCIDEIVSVATLVLDALGSDNRTFGSKQLQYISQAHERAWLRGWDHDDDAPLNPRRVDICDMVLSKLLLDPRDKCAYVSCLPPAPSPRPPPRHRPKVCRQQVSAQDLARLRHASAELKRISQVTKMNTPKAKAQPRKKGKKIYRRTISSTPDILLYRTARRLHTVG